MRRISIEAEISASSYKRLVKALAKYNRKQLWKILDHYIFHIMEDKEVDELLKILKSFEETNSFDEPFEQKKEESGEKVYEPDTFPDKLTDAKLPLQASAPVKEESDEIKLGRPVLSSPLTERDIIVAKDKLNLLFDVNYFTYLTRDVAVANAQALLTYSKSKGVPPAPHWDLVANSSDFFDAAEDVDDEDEGVV